MNDNFDVIIIILSFILLSSGIKMKINYFLEQ